MLTYREFIKLIEQEARKAALEEAAKACERIGSEANNDWNQRLGVADELVDIADSCATEIRQLAEDKDNGC